MQFHAAIQPAQFIIVLYTWHSLIIVPQRKPNIVAYGGKNTRLEKQMCKCSSGRKYSTYLAVHIAEHNNKIVMQQVTAMLNSFNNYYSQG